MKPQEASGDCLTLDTRFNGVLDGQGHTIYNLYCDRCAAKGFPYSMAVGVVGFLGGNADYANGGNGEKTEAEFKTAGSRRAQPSCWVRLHLRPPHGRRHRGPRR